MKVKVKAVVVGTSRPMKDSGVEWIGLIPSNWELNRLQQHLVEIKEKNNPIKTTQVLSLTNKLGVIPYEEKGNQGNKAKDDYSQYGIAYENTLVINSMNVLIGSVGLSHYYGCVSPVYYVFHNNDNTDLRFVNYIFQTEGFQKELRNYANGILEIRLRVSAHDMLRRLIPTPSFYEQVLISDFLDAECTRIDSIIENTHKSIEEYAALKQSFINVEFERVENMNYPRYKMCHLGKLKNGLNFTVDDSMEKIKLLGVGDFQNHLVLDSKEMFSSVPINVSLNNDYCLQDEDIVFVRSNGSKELVGRSVLVRNIDYPLTYSGFCIRFRKHDNVKLVAEYLLLFCRSERFKELLKQNSFGTNITNLSQDLLNSIRIPLPPIEEQTMLVKRLSRRIQLVNKIMEEKESLVEGLEKYKKTLIYEYVTGKKEVPT